MRRGVPSAQTVWGNSVAILTGDLLFARASKLIAGLGERGAHRADRHLRAALPRPAARDDRTAPGRGSDRPLPAGARRQDRVAHRGRRPGRRHLLGCARGVPRAGRALRRADRRRLPAHRRRDRPVVGGGEHRQVGRHRPARRRADPAAALPAPRRRDRPGIRRPAHPDRTRGPSSDETGPAFTAAVAELRDHQVTRDTLTEAHRWADEAVAALAPLPEGPVKKALTKFAEAIVERSS